MREDGFIADKGTPRIAISKAGKALPKGGEVYTSVYRRHDTGDVTLHDADGEVIGRAIRTLSPWYPDEER